MCVTDPEPQGEGEGEEELQGVAERDGLGEVESVPDCDVEKVAEAHPVAEIDGEVEDVRE